jgi:mRNA interferase RelE/StbE
MYEIIFDKKVIEFLEKLQLSTRRRIFEKIISTKENPFHYFEKLKKRDEYKLRVGSYRVIADINKTKKLINVLVVNHRKRIYKRH